MTRLLWCLLGITVVATCVSCSKLSFDNAELDTGLILYNDDKFSEAIPHLRKALETSADGEAKSTVLTIIGNCLCELEQFEESLETLDKALAENPKNHKAYVSQGINYRLMGKFEKAKEVYEKALVLAPDYAELHASLGALAVYQSDSSAAIAHLERALKLDDSLAIAHSNLALAFASAGRFDEADQKLKDAIIRGYKNGSVVKERIDLLRKAADSNP